MRQHEAAIAASVHVGVDDASVLSRKGDVLLRYGETGQKESGQEQSENAH
jgi:hypothetical protein